MAQPTTILAEDLVPGDRVIIRGEEHELLSAAPHRTAKNTWQLKLENRSTPLSVKKGEAVQAITARNAQMNSHPATQPATPAVPDAAREFVNELREIAAELEHGFERLDQLTHMHNAA